MSSFDQLPYVIIGAGGHGFSIAEILISTNKRVLGFVDVFSNPNITKLKYEYLGTDEVLKDLDPNQINIAVGMASWENWQSRNELINELTTMGFNFPVLFGNNCHVVNSVIIGSGTQVLTNAFINSNSVIGKNVIINSFTIIEHDVSVFDNVQICPGVIVCGNVNIEQNCFIGAGTVIKNGITIGENSVIGAGTVLIKDVKPNSKIVGNPGRQI